MYGITLHNPYATHNAQPSAIRRYYESMMGMTKSSGHYDEREGTVHTVVESGATGAALGAAHALLPTGLDVKNAPVDAIAGLISLLASKASAGPIGRAAHAFGDRAIAVWAFRSTARLIAAKKGITLHGEDTELSGDELEEAAKNL